MNARHLRSWLAVVSLALMALMSFPAPSPAAQTSSLTGLELEYESPLWQAANGCPKGAYASLPLIAPGQGPAFSDLEYESGWVVTVDALSEAGNVLATVSTTEAYTSTSGGKHLNITLDCKAARKLLLVGYGSGSAVRLAVTSAVYDDGDTVLETSAGVGDVNPGQVVTLVPLKAKKVSGGGYRITTRAQVWTSVEQGFGWADPLRPIKVTGLWKGCPFRTTDTADNGRFTVTWAKKFLYNGTNFGYSISEDVKNLGWFSGGWKIKDPTTFRATESYYDGCGGA